MKSKRKPAKAYIVRRLNWWYNDEFYDYTVPGETLCAFRSRDKAEDHRRQLEAQARGTETPFDYGDSFEDITNLSDEEIERRFAAADIVYPTEADDEGWDRGEWRIWWEENVDEWTPEQRQAAWDVFEEVRFFEIVEIEIED
jgi:hypothetical protein